MTATSRTPAPSESSGSLVAFRSRPLSCAASRVAGFALLGLAVVFISGLLQRELDYDEAIYLNIAKAIGRTGLPYSSCREDLGQYQLFVDSPPLVTLVAAITQKLWPYTVLPSRVVHAAAFLLPLLVLVWHIGSREYGPWPACIALLTVLGNPLVLYYGTCIRLDVPLALFTLLALWAFYRASEDRTAASRWSLIAGGALGAAIWTKYQAVCIPFTILTYLAYTYLCGDREFLNRARAPLVAMTIAGLGAVLALYGYLYLVPSGDEAYYQGGVAGNLGRFMAPEESWRETLWRVASVVVIMGAHLSWPGLAVCFGAVAGRTTSRFTPLLVCLGVTTILFNLASFRLPGAGAWYLTPMLPAVALLIGRIVAASLDDPRRWLAVLVLASVAVLVVMPFRAFPVWKVARWTQEPSSDQRVADHIRQHSRPQSAVLADSCAIEFYSDRPTAPMQFTSSAAVLQYLASESPHQVLYVAVPRSWLQRPPPTLTPIWKQCRSLLKHSFQPVPKEFGRLVLFQRFTQNHPHEWHSTW